MSAVVLLVALAATTHAPIDCAQRPAACQRALAWGRKQRRHDAQTIRRLEHALYAKHEKARLPHRSQLLCIHRLEGPWDANTGNGYYGGLQMDQAFEAAYGPAYVARWGHASNWRPVFQMLAAERAIRVRGYSPWPNTARACGLLP